MDINQVINYATANSDKVIVLIIGVVLLLAFLKIMNKIVKMLSSIAFIVYVLIQLFGANWVQHLMTIGK